MITKRRLVAAMLAVVATIAFAANYYFPISAAGPEYANETIDTDRDAEWTGANKVSGIYMHYVSVWSLLKFKLGYGDDTLYVSYADGQIAEFKVLDPTSTYRIKFVKKVASVPPGTRNFPLTAWSPLVGNAFGTSERNDYINMLNRDIFVEVYKKTPSVTIIQYDEGAGSGGCKLDCNPPVELNLTPIGEL